MATLHDKIYGCLAASRVASAMGAAVEGWNPQRIQETYGYVDRLYPYLHYAYRGVDWQRPPGTTEDGIERQKLMCQAIITKGDRITAEDLARTAVEITDPQKMWFMSEPGDQRQFGFLRAGVPAAEVGRLTNWHGLNAVARAGHPIGLINAGDPEAAAHDAADIGRLLFIPTDVALVWAGVYVGAIAAAMLPEATVDSVLEAGLRQGTERVRGEIERALEIAGKHSDPMVMRDEFYTIYNGTGIPYAMSYASETVSKALAIFKNVGADPKRAILTGVNFGRDTDCMAAMAGGLAGALVGVGGVPEEWIRQVDEATAANPYTNIVCTIKEHADGVYGALQQRMEKARNWLALWEN